MKLGSVSSASYYYDKCVMCVHLLFQVCNRVMCRSNVMYVTLKSDAAGWMHHDSISCGDRRCFFYQMSRLALGPKRPTVEWDL